MVQLNLGGPVITSIEDIQHTALAQGEEIKPEVHVSDVNSFRSCRIKWMFSSRMRHNLRPVRPNKHLFLGSALHYALGAYYGAGSSKNEWIGMNEAYEAFVERGLSRVVEAVIDVPPYLTEYVELGRTMLNHYAMWSALYDDFTVIMPEISLKYDFGSYIYKGTTDLLIRDTNGDLWLVEHKSYSQFPQTATLRMTMQAAVYTWVARNTPELAGLGNIKGMMYNVLRKSKPTLPKVTKTGKLERRKNINCTPMLYRSVARAQGFDGPEYMAFANTLDPHRFNQRHYLSYPDGALVQTVREFDAIAEEMIGAPIIYRGDVMRSCGYCDYLPLCQQRSFGEGWQSIAEFDYVRGEDEYAHPESDD